MRYGRLCVFLIPALCFLSIERFNGSSRIVSYYQDYFSSKNASLCACRKCMMDYEPQFSELLLQAPELFLSTKYNLSEGDYSWWLGLQPQRKRSYSSYKQLLEKAFTMFPTGPEISRPSPDRCLTCALVGNSGNLNGSYYGPLIDFHDIVIRINSAQVKGYEKDVGTKTTHHVMYPVSATNISSSTHLVLFAFKTSDLAWLINALTPKVEKGNKTSLEANKDLVGKMMDSDQSSCEELLGFLLWSKSCTCDLFCKNHSCGKVRNASGRQSL